MEWVVSVPGHSDRLGKGDKLRQRSDLLFFHHPLAVFGACRSGGGRRQSVLIRPNVRCGSNSEMLGRSRCFPLWSQQRTSLNRSGRSVSAAANGAALIKRDPDTVLCPPHDMAEQAQSIVRHD